MCSGQRAKWPLQDLRSLISRAIVAERRQHIRLSVAAKASTGTATTSGDPTAPTVILKKLMMGASSESGLSRSGYATATEVDEGREGLMKKYLIGVTILGVAFTLFGYAFTHGTPDWLRIAAQVGVAFLLILGSVYKIFPPKDGRIRSGLFTIIFPPSCQRWLLEEPVEKGNKQEATIGSNQIF